MILHDLEAEFSTLIANKKMFSALIYVLSVFMSYVINQSLLLIHLFPSDEVLGLGQMVANVLLLWAGCKRRLIQIPSLNNQVVRLILPLPLTFLGRILACVSTRRFAFPFVLTNLCQLNVMVTLILEKYVLDTTTPFLVKSSVLAMVVGALITTLGEPCSWIDYIMILLSNSFVAANQIYLKKILVMKHIGMCGLLYYDSLFCALAGLIVTWCTNDLPKIFAFKNLTDINFLCHFHMLCLLGFVKSFSVILCIQYNGALTTAVVGTLTRIVLCYLEIVITSSHVIFWADLLGFILGVFGSLLYLCTFKRISANICTQLENIKV